MMNYKKNFVTVIILQIVNIISGLILPRVILVSFGSEQNGLVSAIMQFLSFINLVEGGLGAVVLYELYKPLENEDENKILQILKSCDMYFNRIGLIYVFFSVFIGCVLSIKYNQVFDFKFTFLLTLILALGNLIQYLFCISNKQLLQANQKIYIVNIANTIQTLLNLLITVIAIKILPEIRFVKLMASLVFLIQPIIYRHYIPAKYSRKHRRQMKGDFKLANRWSGLAQNLTFFINTNTDVMVISIFDTLMNVSIYSVYMLPINALKTLITAINVSYQTSFGKLYAIGNEKKYKMNFERFNSIIHAVVMIFFGTCLLLINPFIDFYTTGIHEGNYYQPIFALIMVMAIYFYCVCEPYRVVIQSTGKFRETIFGSYAEAIINIVISVILVHYIGIVGAALGTLVAEMYKRIYYIYFFNKTVLYKNLKMYKEEIIKSIIFWIVNFYFYYGFPIRFKGFTMLIVTGIFVLVFEIVFTLILFSFKPLKLFLEKAKNVED